MNRDNHEPAQNDLLAIVQRLEQIVQNGQSSNQNPSDPNEISEDFVLAQLGLNLVRRAAQVDQAQAVGFKTGEPGETKLSQTEKDTDRWGTAHANTYLSANCEASAPPTESACESSSKRLPRRIGRFEILRELGRGGFGLVLLGLDPELDRQVAIKVPRLEMLADEDARSRFNREACLASTLSHPSIVPVYEYSAGPGVPFIAFGLCRGPSLADWLKTRSTPINTNLATKLILRLAGAIQYAHQRGVVHRDLKPGNVLIDVGESELRDPIDENLLVDSVRISDFGLAKSMEPANSNVTWAGAIVGTPNYMAPEQAQGKAGLTPATDVYSLGAILFELLTGQPPFKRDNDLATLRAIESEEPPRPGRLNSLVSPDLEAVCLKCLEKNPRHRYASAFQLQQDLEHVIAGLPVTARRASGYERMVRWCHRNPLVASLAAATSMAISIALISALSGWYSTKQALEREKIARTQADQANEDAKSAIDTYFVTVSESRLLATPGLKPLRQELLQNAIRYYSSFIERHREDQQLGWDLIKAFLYRAMVDDELGEYPQAREGYAMAWRMLEELETEQPNDPKIKQQASVVLRKLARLDRMAGNHASALEKIALAIELNESLLLANFNLANTHGELGQLLSQRANIFLNTGKPRESLEEHRHSENHFQQALEREPESDQWEHFLTQSKLNQAHFYQQTGDNVTAVELFHEGAKRLRGLADRFPNQLVYQVDFGKALVSLSLARRALNRQEEALGPVMEATAAFDRLATIHPQVVMYQVLRSGSRQEAADILNNLDRLPECEILLTEALQILHGVQAQAASNALISQTVSLIHVRLGRLYQRQDNPAKARQHLQVAIDRLEPAYNVNPRDLPIGSGLADSLQLMAVVMDDHDEAIRLLDRAEIILEGQLETRPESVELQALLEVNQRTRQTLNDQGH